MKKEIKELYKSIRRLHRKFPVELRFMGNQYVREEFKRHKDSKPDYIPGFIKEWTNYRNMMSAQVQSNIVGAKLNTEIVDQLSNEQLGQLYELRSATKSIGLKKN